VIARARNKPAVYYDPSAILDKNHLDARGIQIISGVNELRNWFEKVILN
jgi:polysaccharide biosynthesis PFTS motif protein